LLFQMDRKEESLGSRALRIREVWVNPPQESVW
jgi:hypothetical protein